MISLSIRSPSKAVVGATFMFDVRSDRPNSKLGIYWSVPAKSDEPLGSVTTDADGNGVFTLHPDTVGSYVVYVAYERWLLIPDEKSNSVSMITTTAGGDTYGFTSPEFWNQSYGSPPLAGTIEGIKGAMPTAGIGLFGLLLIFGIAYLYLNSRKPRENLYE